MFSKLYFLLYSLKSFMFKTIKETIKVNKCHGFLSIFPEKNILMHVTKIFFLNFLLPRIFGIPAIVLIFKNAIKVFSANNISE